MRVDSCRERGETSRKKLLFGLVDVFHVLYFVLFVLHLLAELGIVLLEALADALLRRHPLEHAAVEAAGLAGG